MLENVRNKRYNKIKILESLKYYGYTNILDQEQTFYMYKPSDVAKTNRFRYQARDFDGIPYAHFIPIKRFMDILNTKDNVFSMDDLILPKLNMDGLYNKNLVVSKLPPGILDLVAQYSQSGYLEFRKCFGAKRDMGNEIATYYTSWYPQDMFYRENLILKKLEKCTNQIFIKLAMIGYRYAKSKLTPTQLRKELAELENSGFEFPRIKNCFVYRVGDTNVTGNDARSVYASDAMSTSFESNNSLSKSNKLNMMRIYIPDNGPGVKALPIFLFGDTKNEFEIVLVDVILMRDKHYDDQMDLFNYDGSDEIENWVAISKSLSDHLFLPTMHHRIFNRN